MSSDRKRNVVLIMSDQHQPRGVASSLAVTPHLDALARRGTRFRSAYCTSPICVPARASVATGRYVHELGTWDNAAPYRGTPPSWGHLLGAAGYSVTTIGKLHYRDDGDDTGFPDQRLAMHVHGFGDLRGIAGRPNGEVPRRDGRNRSVLDVGVGESEYTEYDRAVADEAVAFLDEETDGGPWALMVSFVAPHFPLVSPQEYYDRYDPSTLPRPVDTPPAWEHPTVDVFRRTFGLTEALSPDEHRRALHGYLARCSFLDDRVGDVSTALERSGHHDDTLVVYTSDHGENAGEHGLWLKHLMTEASVGVPMIVAGPGVAAGRIVDTPASHVDLLPTFADWAGLSIADMGLPGRSLLDLEAVGSARSVMAEYHANGTTAASFMLRDGAFKYLYHVGERPQLFDLHADPDELTDLAGEPEYADVLTACHARLLSICDPDEVDARAKADQAARVAGVGGVEAARAHTVPYTPVPTR